MIARIYFINHPTIELSGETLGSFESGALISIKDYSKPSSNIIASVPISQLLFIEYIDAPKVIVPVKEIKKEALIDTGFPQ